MTLPYDSYTVIFPSKDMEEPCIVLIGLDDVGQQAVIDSIPVGPFPDWESISRRVMRRIISGAQAALVASCH